jgi:hypothetical protein
LTRAEKKKIAAEEALQEGCCELDRLSDRLGKGKRINIAATAKRLGLDYYQLRRRWKGISHARSEGQIKNRYMTFEQEEVLEDWCTFLALIGLAQPRDLVFQKCFALTGKLPTRSWYKRFLKRHPKFNPGRGSGLDPARAQCFNFATVQAHFDALSKRLKELNIPWEHVWNMDEKGIQLGGGRKGSIHYLFPRHLRHKVRLTSDNLELVTIVECVSATGVAMPPGFIFSGNAMCPEWFETGHGPDDFL